MKTYWLTEKNDENKGVFFLTVDGDIVDTIGDANLAGCRAKIIVHGMYPGSLDEWREWIRNTLKVEKR